MGEMDRPLLAAGYSFVIWAVCLIPACLSTCTYPADIRGLWYTSQGTNAELTWLDGNVTSFEYKSGDTFSGLTYECIIKEGNFYVSKTTTTVELHLTDFYIYTCWVFTKMSSDKYLYRHAVTKYASAENARIKIFADTVTVTDASTVCDDTDYDKNQYSILIRNGTAEAQSTTCASPLLATGRYTLTDDGGTTYCDDNSWIDGCTDKSTLTANYTICSDNVFYSAEGVLYCMYSTGFGQSGVYYTTLWNADASPDQSSTYYFLCAVSDSRSDGVHVTYYHGDCLDAADQNATYISESDGFSLVIQTNTTCAPSSSESNLGLILGIVFGLLFLIALIVLLCYVYYIKVYLAKKQRASRAGSKVVPDTLPNTSMSQGDKNYRMMFTPAPPKSAAPGGRHHDYRDNGKYGSQTSVRPPVSQLAFYRTPTPRITDSKVDDSPSPSSNQPSKTNQDPSSQNAQPGSKSAEPLSVPQPKAQNGPHAGDKLADTINQNSDSTAVPPISKQNSTTGTKTQGKQINSGSQLKSNNNTSRTNTPTISGSLAPVEEILDDNSNVKKVDDAKNNTSAQKNRPQSKTLTSTKIGNKTK